MINLFIGLVTVATFMALGDTTPKWLDIILVLSAIGNIGLGVADMAKR